MAFAHCEDRLGGSWVCAPSRWGTGPFGTLDGCVPVRVVWARFQSLSMHRATDAMDTARAIGLAFGTEQAGDDARRKAATDAYPDRG